MSKLLDEAPWEAMNPLRASTVRPLARIPVRRRGIIDQYYRYGRRSTIDDVLTPESRESGVFPSSDLALLDEVL
jgi:hypothetical protein